MMRAALLLDGTPGRNEVGGFRNIAWMLGASVIVLPVETVFWVGEHKMKFFLWVSLAALLFGPAYYLLRTPDAQIPALAQVLLDVLLFFLAWWLSRDMAASDAKKQANSRWVPQARQACRGLLTVCADVRAFRQDLAKMCATLARELPEMQDEKMNGARVVLGTQCKSGANRLDSIANHLADSVAAWESFIIANCEGLECSQISDDLTLRRQELERQIQADGRIDQCHPFASSVNFAAKHSPVTVHTRASHSAGIGSTPPVTTAAPSP